VLGFLSVSTWRSSCVSDLNTGFNPVLGFLSVSTGSFVLEIGGTFSFNPVLGFLSVSTDRALEHRRRRDVSIPCWVF